MSLEHLPQFRDVVVVVGTSYRKPLPILQAHLESLDAQEWPSGHRPYYVAVPDFTPAQADAQEYLFRWIAERNGELIAGIPAGAADFDDQHPNTHQWTSSAMARVGANKNFILHRALEIKADFLFFCDADLILDRTTIHSLLACEKPIATAVYWSQWSKIGHETRQLHAAPQVWLQHPYGLQGRGMDEAEFRQKLVNRDLTRVWGFGACTLLNRRAIESGIDFSYLPDVPQDGMMAGEDRHFCIKAERLHLDAFADPWPDIFHIYHPEDVEKIPAYRKRLLSSHPDYAQHGDLVSVRLKALEPILISPGKGEFFPPVLTRGRLGSLPVVPELEEAIANIRRGETQIVRIHPSVHFPMPQLRGRTRLIEVTVIDVKRNSYPPVLEDELYVGPKSGAWLDQAGLWPDQHESIREIGMAVDA